ncbi:MAG: hypothetical protein JKY65_16525 [Planctomycetes bacterium]|nr:hypothetical protein [Planctomycetota bacterium]
MQAARTQPNSTPSRVLQSIRARGRGSVLVPTDFLSLGTRRAVDAALGRLADSGTIRRVGRGVYDFPKSHPRFGPRPPSADAVAQAVARSTGESICSGDAKAASLLGVSTQVPAQAVYLTDGTSRVLAVDLGNGRGFDIRFKRSTRRIGLDSKAGLVLRALHFLGRNGVDDAAIRKLGASLSDSDARHLARLRSQATGWMRSIIDSIISHRKTNKVMNTNVS